MKTEQNGMTTLERFIFAFADVFGGGGQALLGVLYLVFLTDVVGLNAGLAGTVIMIAMFWDAINDPLMGHITDNARTRWGRRKPFLMLGGLLLVPAMSILWLPIRFESVTGQFAWAVGSYLIYLTISTMIYVPYNSLGTEISINYVERNRANMTRTIFSLMGTVVCTIVPTFVFNLYQKGTISIWQLWGLIIGCFGLILFAVPQLLAGMICQERAPYEDKKEKFTLHNIFRPLKVQAFRKLLGMYLAQSITMDVVSAVAIYYATYVITGMSATVFIGCFLGVQLIMFPLINSLVNKVSKTRIYGFGLPLSIVGALGIALYPSGWPVAGLYACTVLTALGFAGAITMSWVLFADVVDIGELSLKERPSGAFSALMTLMRRACSAVIIFLVGQIINITGYIAPVNNVPVLEQPSVFSSSLRMIVFFTFLLLAGGGWLLARNFHISPQVSGRVRYYLEKQQADILDSLPPEEQRELDDLLKEFG